MENILLVIKGILLDTLSSFGLTLALLSLFATMFKDEIKLPFDTFWNKYIVFLWSICFIISFAYLFLFN